MNTNCSSRSFAEDDDRPQVSELRQPLFVGVLGILMCVTTLARAQDCNNNGVPDSSEIPPQSGLFEDAVESVYSQSYSDIKLADMDNDGDLDLVSCHSSRMRVEWNVGDGTFIDPGRFDSGGSLIALDVGDLNHDGFQDVVVTQNSGLFSASLEVFLNEGTGLLGPRVSYPTGGFGYLVSARMGDIDHDGDLDVVVGDQSISTPVATIYPNNGDGTFATPVEYAGIESCKSLALNDLDQDGDLDIAAVVSGNELVLLQNDGAGIYSESSRMPIGNNPSKIEAADFTGDGYDDLVVANRDDDNISVLINDGTGAFVENRLFYAGIGPERIQVADLDGDGDLDLAVSAQQAPSGHTNMSLLFNTGAGTFVRYVYSARGIGLSAGDIDADGDIDLVAATGSSLKIIRHKDGDCNGNIVLDECDITFATSNDCNGNGISDTCEIATGAAADCNANNIPDECDIVAGTSSDCDADGTPDECPTPGDLRLFETEVRYETNSYPYSGAMGDLNDDGYPDLVTIASAKDEMSVIMNNGDGSFADEVTHATGDYPNAVAIGDVDGDGRTDISVLNQRDDNYSIFLQTPTGTFIESMTVGVGQTNSDPTEFVACDSDNDGDLDLVWASQNHDVVTIDRNNGNGMFTSGPSIDVLEARNLVAGDLNGDSFPDIVATSTNGRVAVLLNDGSETFVSRIYYETGASFGSQSLALGDLDGDGDLDLAAANVTHNFVSLLFNDGNGALDDVMTVPAFGAPISVFIGDVNEDGINDIVTANYSGYSVSVITGLGDGTFEARRNYRVGKGPAWVAGEDVDGDGDMDLVTTNLSESSVSILMKANDCNLNGIYDACEIESGAGSDCDENGVLDVCDPDTDGDGVPDGCDVCEGFDDLLDFDGDGIPNGCEAPCIDTLLGDVDDSGNVDVADIGAFSAVIVNPAAAAGSAYCAADVNQDLRVDGSDIQEFVAMLVAP